MITAALALSMLVGTPVNASPVSVASGDWSDIPKVGTRGLKGFEAYAVDKVDSAISNECKMRAPNKSLELNVPFLIEFAPSGEVKRVVVQRINCATAESVIGSAVLALAKEGEFQPTGENQAGWYRGEFSLLSR